MYRYIFIITLFTLIFSYSQENRLFWDGSEWNNIKKKSNYDNKIEYQIKSSYIYGVLDGRLYGYLKTWAENATLANEVFAESVDYLSVREIIKNLDYFYEDPFNNYLPVPSAIIISNMYGKRIPLETINKYIKDSRDWINSITIDLDTLNYNKLIQEKFLKNQN